MGLGGRIGKGNKEFSSKIKGEVERRGTKGVGGCWRPGGKWEEDDEKEEEDWKEGKKGWIGRRSFGGQS